MNITPAEGLRRCPRCKGEKPIDQFRPRRDPARSATARDTYCIPCRRAIKREAHARARERLAAEHGRQPLCPICRLEPAEHLDHDHATGIYRGWLGARCNQGLGFFRDDPALLRAAADYLEDHLRGNPRRGLNLNDYELVAEGETP